MRKCCVIGCRTGYDNSTEKYSAFKFPRDENLKKKWLLAIGRQNFTPSNYAGVCEKHFLENDIVRYQISVDPETGADVLFPTRAQLKEGVVPTLKLHTNVEVKLETEHGSFVNDQRKLKVCAVPTKNLTNNSDHLYMSSLEAIDGSITHIGPNDENRPESSMSENSYIHKDLAKQYRLLQLEFEILQDQVKERESTLVALKKENALLNELLGTIPTGL
ncbi:hypothetical protein D910_03252 [Dendroctonus ponderosae]